MASVIIWKADVCCDIKVYKFGSSEWKPLRNEIFLCHLSLYTVIQTPKWNVLCSTFAITKWFPGSCSYDIATITIVDFVFCCNK